jgi:hypothetical protein
MTDSNTLKILDAIAEVRVEAQETRTEIADLRGEMREGFALRPQRDEITTAIKTTISDYCAAQHGRPSIAPKMPAGSKVVLALVGAITALTTVIVVLSS